MNKQKADYPDFKESKLTETVVRGDTIPFS